MSSASPGSRSPLHYDAASSTYFTCTLRPGTSVAAFTDVISSLKPTELPLSCLGSVGPGDMATEVVVVLVGVPSSEASSSERVTAAKEWLESRAELDGRVTVMEFKLKLGFYLCSPGAR